MEDFLKDRPVLDPKSALVLAADPKPAAAIKVVAAPSPAPGTPPAAGSPFADLRAGVSAASAPKPAAKTSAGVTPLDPAPAAAAQALKGEHGTKVQTVVERGRVTKIIVTCTCGKVTEIACQY